MSKTRRVYANFILEAKKVARSSETQSKLGEILLWVWKDVQMMLIIGLVISYLIGILMDF